MDIQALHDALLEPMGGLTKDVYNGDPSQVARFADFVVTGYCAAVEGNNDQLIPTQAEMASAANQHHLTPNLPALTPEEHLSRVLGMLWTMFQAGL